MVNTSGNALNAMEQLINSIASFTIVAWTWAEASRSLANVNIVDAWYTKYKETLLPIAWVYTVTWSVYNSGWNNVMTRLYVNWSAIWTEHIKAWDATTTTYSEDITIAAWDLLQIYGHYVTSASTNWVFDEYITFNMKPYVSVGTVIL